MERNTTGQRLKRRAGGVVVLPLHSAIAWIPGHEFVLVRSVVETLDIASMLIAPRIIIPNHPSRLTRLYDHTASTTKVLSDPSAINNYHDVTNISSPTGKQQCSPALLPRFRIEPRNAASIRHHNHSLTHSRSD